MSASLADARAVVFDVDGTLYHQKPVQRGMLQRLVLGHAVRPWRGPRTLRALSAYRKGQEALRATGQRYEDLGRAQVEYAAERIGLPAREVAGLVAHWMEERPLDLVARAKRDGLDALVRALRGRGLKLGVFSDYPPEGKLDALGLHDAMSAVVWAQQPEVGRFKPDPTGILRVAELLDVAPSATVYVGDRIEVDARAAEAAGMRGVVFGSAGDGPTHGATFVRDCAELGRLLGVDGAAGEKWEESD